MTIMTTRQKKKNVVIFDRFFAEEAYSFHIRKHHPSALRVLDMQDMHSLRAARSDLVKSFRHGQQPPPFTHTKTKMTQAFMKEIMTYIPTSSSSSSSSKVSLKSQDIFLREMVSIHRSDVILVCSPYEKYLLQYVYNVPSYKLVLAPFFTTPVPHMHTTSSSSTSSSSSSSSYDYNARSDFVVLGGYKHTPNVDSIHYLQHEIWPLIRSKLPHVNVHVYGAYSPSTLQKQQKQRRRKRLNQHHHHDDDGFYIKGYVHTLEEELGKRRVLLAPLRYGAGIKGKIVDAWRCGCPVVTTPIGAEGMTMPSSSSVNAMDTAEDEYNDLDGLILQYNSDSYYHDIYGTSTSSSSSTTGEEANNTTAKNNTNWGGTIASDTQSFVNASIDLYTNKHLWNSKHQTSHALLSTLFDKETNLNMVSNQLALALEELEQRRCSTNDLMGSLLWHQTVRSTEYFSRWIELKNEK
mmetsp:Transcript_37645/g.55045  ORF Transcript_37645/g.55045 Transcript_37645/m.55045 type:complete len:463 (-) Transcript_37645:188-1576(-)